MMYIKELEKSLESTKNKLINHNLYSNLNSKTKLIKFMETHVYAVWDFMSLIKALQRNLTCIEIPWTPNKNNLAGRLVNEIVLAEESDINLDGNVKSHFELYKESMKEIGASTLAIDLFTEKVKKYRSYENAINEVKIDKIVKEFMNFTFEIINFNKNHVIASVFTFGREDLIPEMFIEIVKKLSSNNEINAKNLIYYLERHIEVDADEHGPMALKMIEELCKDDQKKWEEAKTYSLKALEMRIKLWDHINEMIS